MNVNGRLSNTFIGCIRNMSSLPISSEGICSAVNNGRTQKRFSANNIIKSIIRDLNKVNICNLLFCLYNLNKKMIAKITNIKNRLCTSRIAIRVIEKAALIIFFLFGLSNISKKIFIANGSMAYDKRNSQCPTKNLTKTNGFSMYIKPAKYFPYLFVGQSLYAETPDRKNAKNKIIF